MLLAASVVFTYYTIWAILLVRERQQAYLDMIAKGIPSISHFLTPQAKFIISFHRVNGQ